jgi:hypothetical protein
MDGSRDRYDDRQRGRYEDKYSDNYWNQSSYNKSGSKYFWKLYVMKPLIDRQTTIFLGGGINRFDYIVLFKKKCFKFIFKFLQ